MIKTEDLRKMSVTDLQKKLAELRGDILDLRFKHATGQLEKVSNIPGARRDIARVLTILKEKGA